MTFAVHHASFRSRQPLPKALPRQMQCSSLCPHVLRNTNCRAGQAACGLKAIQMIWLASDMNDFKICLTIVHSKVGLTLTEWNSWPVCLFCTTNWVA